MNTDNSKGASDDPVQRKSLLKSESFASTDKVDELMNVLKTGQIIEAADNEASL
jgi:hypothetical protein